jgi:hypothetical protein
MYKQIIKSSHDFSSKWFNSPFDKLMLLCFFATNIDQNWMCTVLKKSNKMLHMQIMCCICRLGVADALMCTIHSQLLSDYFVS